MKLGPYEILAPIGAGGMGEVWAAQDTRLGRRVAIKFSRADFSERFEREARAVAALNHPNICTLYDVGPNFLVMELVEGETLSERLRRGKLPVEEVLRTGDQIASALEAAHAKGIVHRDLKPGNIMLSAHGVKVLDFGLAKSALDDSLTQTHEAIGTPAYMAPEQFEAKAADARTDLFALGLMLYEMLTGRRPFPGAAVGLMLGGSVAIPSPSKVDSSIPAGWDALLAKLIVKDPSRRLQSAQAVKAALATKDLRPRQVRLPRTAVLAFAAALMTLAAGLGYRAWNGRTGPAVRALAILPFDNLTGDVAQASLAGGLGSALQSDLSVVPALRVVSVAPEESTGPAAELGRKLSVEALARGTLRASGHRLSLSVELIETATGRVYFSKEYQGEAGDLQRIEKEAARATAAALRVPAQDPAVKALAVSTPINAEAYDLFLRAGYHARRDNESDIDQAIALLERSAGLDPAYGPTHSELARAYGTKSFYFHPGDAQLEERGFAALQRAMAIDPNSADTHFARGMMLWRPSQGFPSREALAEFRHAFERRPSFDEAWHQHGVVSLHVGHLATAEKDIDRALSINPANAQARFRYAPILVYQLRYEEAIARLNQVPRQVLPTQWVHQMAWALLSLGRRGEAARFIDDALKAGGADPGGVLHAARAMLHAMAGNRTAAEFDISEAVRVGTGFGHFHHTAYSIGAAYSVMGDYRKAQLWIEKAANDGFPNYTLFEKDPHLAGARTTPSFRAFLAKLRQDWEHIPGEPE